MCAVVFCARRDWSPFLRLEICGSHFSPSLFDAPDNQCHVCTLSNLNKWVAIDRIALGDEMTRRIARKLVKPYLSSDLGPGHHTGSGLRH
jgi:hypothetical protein